MRFYIFTIYKYLRHNDFLQAVFLKKIDKDLNKRKPTDFHRKMSEVSSEYQGVSTYNL